MAGVVVAIAFLCATLTVGEEYSVDIDYTCQDGSGAAQQCKSWKQSGKVKKEGAACFPGDATVITRAGPKQMSEVQLTDELLGFDHFTGRSVFTKIRAWLHRYVDVESDMTVIEIDNGRIVTSPKHSIATGNADHDSYYHRYAFARDLRSGHFLLASNGSKLAVRGTHVQKAKGYYSPLTYTSNYFAGADEKSVVLAHSFAHVPFPRSIAWIVHGAMRVAELFSENTHRIDFERERKYLHPVLRQILRFFPLIDTEPEVTIKWQHEVGNLTAAQEYANARVLTATGADGTGQQEEDKEWIVRQIMNIMKPPFLF
mmetsp:Transcript_58643/g.107940  ORF Transcript_58643/g.107940 Transcript_58643/m.107940 type:complete len:314 (+) Transcript_58643:62-1003(+)